MEDAEKAAKAAHREQLRQAYFDMQRRNIEEFRVQKE